MSTEQQIKQLEDRLNEVQNLRTELLAKTSGDESLSEAIMKHTQLLVRSYSKEIEWLTAELEKLDPGREHVNLEYAILKCETMPNKKGAIVELQGDSDLLGRLMGKAMEERLEMAAVIISALARYALAKRWSLTKVTIAIEAAMKIIDQKPTP